MKLLSVVIFSSLFLADAGFSASEIRSIRVGGERQAEIVVVGATSLPTLRTYDNTIELTFTGAELSESLQGKLDVDSPHALIRRASLFPTDKQSVKASFIVNGSTENLKQRVQLTSDTDGIRLTFDYPKGASAALNLLKEEQLPLSSGVSEATKASAGVSRVHVFFSVVVILLAGVCTFFFMKVLKSRGKWRGSRKFLVEQLGYCPLGPKTGVSLIKVGKEFALIGVTPNQVTFLSNLPKLQEQYEEEAQFERGVFKEAVKEEFNNMNSLDA